MYEPPSPSQQGGLHLTGTTDLGLVSFFLPCYPGSPNTATDLSCCKSPIKYSSRISFSNLFAIINGFSSSRNSLTQCGGLLCPGPATLLSKALIGVHKSGYGTMQMLSLCSSPCCLLCRLPPIILETGMASACMFRAAGGEWFLGVPRDA